MNLLDLEKCFKMSIWLQKSASIQERTSPLKFDHFRSKTPDFIDRIFQLRSKLAIGARYANPWGRKIGGEGFNRVRGPLALKRFRDLVRVNGGLSIEQIGAGHDWLRFGRMQHVIEPVLAQLAEKTKAILLR